MYAPRFPRVLVVLLVCSLAFLFVASVPQLHVRASSSMQQSQPTISTSCPASGTARAAFLPSLKLGSHPTIVYIVNEGTQAKPTFGTLKRYDIVTGSKVEVVKLTQTSIAFAQVSADGQWLLFVAQVSGQNKLQLVRMDGHFLQTLYCSVASVQLSSIQWSVNQKFIIFDTIDTRAQPQIATVILLQVATGKLTTELTGSNQLGFFTVVTWLDNKRVYVLGPPPQPSPIERLSLLDITKNRDIHGGDLQTVTDLLILDTSWSLDSSFDTTKLFLGECQTPENSSGSFSNIFVEPPTGGSQNMIYHDPNRCLDTLRAVTSNTLLFTDTLPTAPHGKSGIKELWKIKPDGSGLTRLFNSGSTSTTAALNTFTQFPWSNVSRNGSQYVLQLLNVNNPNNLTYTLEYGSLKGGAPVVFASITNVQLETVGWTKM